MTYILALVMSLAAFASDQDTFEKTFPRDNTFCQMGSNKLEIMIRGDVFRYDPAEKLWGEHVLARVEDGEPVKLPVTQESGLYRLFQGNPSACTKAIGTMINGKFAVLFQKLNLPHKPQLVIQYFDPKSMRALEVIHSPYLADRAMVKKEAIIVRTHSPERQDIDMGNVTIKGKKYLFQDHRFPLWVKIDAKGFSTEPSITFENFAYKASFKNLEHFKTIAGWDEVGKTFTNTALYVAINHETKSNCIVFLKGKKAITGEEAWICQ